MTRSCCVPCGLRFSRATAAETNACPFCLRPLDSVPPEATLGLKLVAVEALAVDEAAVEQAALLLEAATPPDRPRATVR
jgi:hypothetical protein